MLDRRQIVIGALCTCCGVAAGGASQVRAETFMPRTGCVVRGRDAVRALGSGALAARQSELPSLVAGREKTTGDLALNRSLDLALQRLAKTFGVWPEVGFYDDGQAHNAFAVSYVEAGKARYAVLFGKNFFRKAIAYDRSGITFLQTAAHEFAHVWMYQSGQLDQLLEGQPTVKRAELHADFLAGYYLGSRKLAHPRASFRSAGLRRWESGDFFQRNPQHHGTPRERLAAAEAGFLLAYRKKAGPKAAFAAATAFVQQY